MASDAVISFHNQQMAQERARVLDRIAYGTKASSPQVMMARRMNSLYYSNPLPDNSSGSKNRPIGAMKDESGRADANMNVAMAQGKTHFSHEGMSHGGMRGGVLRNYQYAKTILARRGRNTEDINLASQGLPPVPSPLLELSDVESRKLELDTLLQSLSNQVELGDISSLTIGELKNIPRLMVALAPTFTENDITQLIRSINSLLATLEVSSGDETTPLSKNAEILYGYLDTRLKTFLNALLEIVNLSPEQKMAAVRQLSKEVFKLEPVETRFPSARTQSIPVDEAGMPRKIMRVIRRPRPAEEEPAREEAPEEEPAREEAAPRRRELQISDRQFENLRTAYRNKDLDTLAEFIKQNSRLRAEKNWSSRVVANNRIKDIIGKDISK